MGGPFQLYPSRKKKYESRAEGCVYIKQEKRGGRHVGSLNTSQRPREIPTNAILAVRCVVVALLAQAPEGPHVVDTLSIAADLPGQGGALVDICGESGMKCGGSVSPFPEAQPSPPLVPTAPPYPCNHCCGSVRSPGSKGSCRTPLCSCRCRSRRAGGRIRRCLPGE